MKEWAFQHLYLLRRSATFQKEAFDFLYQLRYIYHRLKKGGVEAKKAAEELKELRKREKDLIIKPPKGTLRWEDIQQERRINVSRDTTNANSVESALAQQVQTSVNQEFALAGLLVEAVATQPPTSSTESPKKMVVVKEPEANQAPFNDLAPSSLPSYYRDPMGNISLSPTLPPFGDLAPAPLV